MGQVSFLGEETAVERELRANTYTLLARLLAGAPDQGLLQRLASLPADAGDGAPLSLAWAELARAARLADPPALEAEYQALFIGVTRGEILPYASWYLTGFLMEKPLAELRADLARLGYARREDVREPEDHAAAVLEVMGQLVAAAHPSQAEFFSRHLRPWLPRLCHDLRTASTARFYRAVAELGAAFLAFETDYIGPGKA